MAVAEAETVDALALIEDPWRVRFGSGLDEPPVTKPPAAAPATLTAPAPAVVPIAPLPHPRRDHADPGF